MIQTESSPVDLPASPLWLGDEKSAVVLTSVISPECPYCREVAKTLLSLLDKGYKFRWNIILGKRRNEDSEHIDNWILGYLTDRNQFIEDLSAWGVTGKPFPDYKSESSSEKKQALEIKQLFPDIIARFKISGFPKIIKNDRLLSSAYIHEDIDFLVVDEL